jgi:hypothetical protein
LELPLVEHGRKKQDFERDEPPQRQLLGFIDHAHAAAADFAGQAEGAQHGARAKPRRGGRRGAFPDQRIRRVQLGQEPQRGE